MAKATRTTPPTTAIDATQDVKEDAARGPGTAVAAATPPNASNGHAAAPPRALPPITKPPGPLGSNNGGNNGGKGITDTPGGLKLQCEGHEVLYRNIWIKELALTEADTEFQE